jgi:large subunit ribosomal protein L7A
MPVQPFEDLSSLKKVIGAKQTMRALEKGLAAKVYLASDADRHLVAPLAELCRIKGVETDETFKLAELGKACAISIGAAAVAVLK